MAKRFVKKLDYKNSKTFRPLKYFFFTENVHEHFKISQKFLGRFEALTQIST